MFESSTPLGSFRSCELEHRLPGRNFQRIEGRFESVVEAYDSGDYAEIVKQADAIAGAAEQGAELSDR